MTIVDCSGLPWQVRAGVVEGPPYALGVHGPANRGEDAAPTKWMEDSLGPSACRAQTAATIAANSASEMTSISGAMR